MRDVREDMLVRFDYESQWRQVLTLLQDDIAAKFLLNVDRRSTTLLGLSPDDLCVA